MNEYTKCAECGMTVFPGEYHPYAACELYRQTHQAEKVTSMIQEVVNHGRKEAEQSQNAAQQGEIERLREALEAAEKYMTGQRAKSKAPFDPEALKQVRAALAHKE